MRGRLRRRLCAGKGTMSSVISVTPAAIIRLVERCLSKVSERSGLGSHLMEEIRDDFYRRAEDLIYRSKGPPDVKRLSSQLVTSLYLEVDRRRLMEGDSATLDTFAHILHLLNLAAERSFYRRSPQAIRRLAHKIIYLCKNDPESLQFLEGFARHVSDSESAELKKILNVIHYTEERIRKWPSHVKRFGPTAAFYYHFGGNKGEIGKLNKTISYPRTFCITFHADGTYHYENSFNPIGDIFTGENRNLLSDLVFFLKRRQLSFTRKSLQSLADDFEVIAQKDPQTFAKMIMYLREKRARSKDWIAPEWKALQKTIESTARFIEKFYEKISWEGNVFEYYRRRHGDKGGLTIFRNRVVYFVQHDLRRHIIFSADNAPKFATRASKNADTRVVERCVSLWR